MVIVLISDRAAATSSDARADLPNQRPHPRQLRTQVVVDVDQLLAAADLPAV